MTSSVARYFIDQLSNFKLKSFRKGKAVELLLLTAFVQHFLSVFITPGFRPDRGQMLRLIELNDVIAFLASITKPGNTDAQVLALLPETNDPLTLCKLMALYSPRNSVEISPDLFFSRDAEAASTWYCSCISSVDWAGAYPAYFSRLRRLLADMDTRLQFTDEVVAPYFCCTYLDDASVAPVRRQIHGLLRQLTLPAPVLQEQTTNKRIAIVTEHWKRGSVVHRALAPFIHALAAEFELTLIHLNNDDTGLDLQGFSNVLHYQFHRNRLDEAQALSGRFGMLVFADIGMGIESIYLASLRLAPVQVALCGHPESSWSPMMDYFIHGADVIDPALAHRQFSERLVLIPGCGQVSTPLPYEWRRIQPQTRELRIACCWSSQKIHPDHLQRLADAIEEVGRPVKFVFFGLDGNFYLPVLRGLQSVLGADNVEVLGWLPYAAYMEALEHCHFGVDSWPFGGYVSLMDLLWLRKPVVALQGTRSFSRNAGFFQSRLGLTAMAVDTPDEFVGLLRRMITDDDFRQQTIATLQHAEVEPVLLSQQSVPAFVAAIRMVQADHSRLKAEDSRDPLWVTA